MYTHYRAVSLARGIKPAVGHTRAWLLLDTISLDSLLGLLFYLRRCWRHQGYNETCPGEWHRMSAAQSIIRGTWISIICSAARPQIFQQLWSSVPWVIQLSPRLLDSNCFFFKGRPLEKVIAFLMSSQQCNYCFFVFVLLCLRTYFCFNVTALFLFFFLLFFQQFFSLA